jgi:hypothetical protein
MVPMYVLSVFRELNEAWLFDYNFGDITYYVQRYEVQVFDVIISGAMFPSEMMMFLSTRLRSALQNEIHPKEQRMKSLHIKNA